jgi:hypothetical protein
VNQPQRRKAGQIGGEYKVLGRADELLVLADEVPVLNARQPVGNADWLGFTSEVPGSKSGLAGGKDWHATKSWGMAGQGHSFNSKFRF